MNLSDQTLDVLAEVVLADEPISSFEAAQELQREPWPVSRSMIWLMRAGLVKASRTTRHPTYEVTPAGIDQMALELEVPFPSQC